MLGEGTGIAGGCAGLILPIFFSDTRRNQPGRASQMDIARALYIAAERGVAIANVSAGQKSATPEAVRHLEDALRLCERKRMLVVAAAGNDGCACLHVPAAVPTVLAVGAMDHDSHPIDQSNWGDSYATNGLLAPGANLDVIGPGGVPGKRTGTSYATAVVSAVAARLLSAARRAAYRLDAIDIRSVLIDSADPCDAAVDGDCAKVLAGRLNVPAAIELLHSRGMKRTWHLHHANAHQSSLLRGGGSPMEVELANSVVDNAGAVGQLGVSAAAGVEQQACSCGGGKGCGCAKCAAEQERDHAVAKSGIVPPAVTGQSSGTLPLVVQQGCGCGGQQQTQLAYAIGALWFDFGSEARYDAIVQAMNDPVAANTPALLLDFWEGNLPAVSGITFILMQDQIPVYAIQPSGPFALDAYKAMLDAIRSSLDSKGDMQRVAIPGVVYGTTRLMNGMSLPVIYPDLRGMVKWKVKDLVDAVRKAVGDDEVDEAAISDFLVRVYDELRNLGLSPQERAVNFAATNAYQAASVFAEAAQRRLELYKIAVKKSPICRPDSDCWDVQLVMFDPENERRAARQYRFTIDVSEVMPVSVGHMRAWNAPLGSVLL